MTINYGPRRSEAASQVVQWVESARLRPQHVLRPCGQAMSYVSEMGPAGSLVQVCSEEARREWQRAAGGWGRCWQCRKFESTNKRTEIQCQNSLSILQQCSSQQTRKLWGAEPASVLLMAFQEQGMGDKP